jgi:uncharacterized protein
MCVLWYNVPYKMKSHVQYRINIFGVCKLDKVKQSKVLRIIDIVVVLAITFFANLVMSAITAIAYTFVYALRGEDLADPNRLMELWSSDISFIMFASIYNLLAIGLVFLFWRFVDKQDIRRLGFARTNHTIKQILWGIIGAVAAVAAIIFFGIIFGIISFNSIGISTFTISQIAIALLVGLFTFLMVGFGEEAVHRAYIQNHLVDLVGNKYGVLISAMIFMAAHLMTYGKVLDLLDVFLAGLILGYCFILTKSIYLPATFHFMWDFLQVNIFRLQTYDYYKGPVLFIYNNSGDLIINNYNFGNKLELIFIMVELMILSLIYLNRKRLSGLAATE